MKSLSTLILLLTYSLCFSQVKFEREYDLPAHEVPEIALSFAQEYFGKLKLKWYAEESDQGKSIEAKSFKRGQSYSIEFSNGGELQDIEKNIKISSLKTPIRNEINARFKSDFDKFKIRKIQIQWSGDFEAVKHFLRTETKSDRLKTAYEIEVEGRRAGSSSMYEYLFTEKGELLRKKEIEERTTTNLEF